ncbi:ameloblastin isoform X1 [Pyxicephalus adspersus]|uniref:ameloblastin isoform X1 n=1 Tax=Pyxicephalus adspersus TaxID=30357 RepID=UPI003B5C6D72
MKELALVLCMLGTVFAYPVNPQVGGTNGMASMSLEKMQQLQALPLIYNDPYSTLWLHGLLPPHMNPWLHQRSQMPDNQQFEYALPIHPPPLPGAPSVGQPAKPGQDGQTVSQQLLSTPAKPDQLMHQPILPMGYPNIQQADPTLIPPKGGPADGQIQTYQTIMNKLLQQGVADPVPDPAVVPPIHQQHPYPNFFFMNYGKGPGLPPGRLGMMSSEEMQGGQAGAAHPFSSLYPGLIGSGPFLGGLPQNPSIAGDFTIEDDTPGAGVKKAGQAASHIPPESSPIGGLNPPSPGLDGMPPGQIDTLPFPNINLPNMGLPNPLGQSKGPSPVTPANDPKMTNEPAAGFAPYGIDEALLFGMQRENPTNIDVIHGNAGMDPPIMHNDIHLQNHYFQEP